MKVTKQIKFWGLLPVLVALQANAGFLGIGGGKKDDKKEEAPVTGGELRTSVTVDYVYVPRKHSDLGIRGLGKWGKWGEIENCKDGFQGAFEDGNVHLVVKATGGAGGYKHTVISAFNDSYKLNLKHDKQFVEKLNGNGGVTMHLPELNDAVPYVQQTVLVRTTDKRGATAVGTLTFTVARPVILSPAVDTEMRKQACFQRFTAYEAMTGVLSNATANTSQIEIKQGLAKLWTSTHGWQWGVFVSPLSAIGLGNLIVFNFSYFQETSKTVQETTEVTTQYNFDPGDYMQVYAQPTRYVTPYDATLVSACGQQEMLPGAFLFQWWGFAYHVYPVNPYSKTPPAIETIGAPPMNTCPENLSPGIKNAADFRRTN